MKAIAQRVAALALMASLAPTAAAPATAAAAGPASLAAAPAAPDTSTILTMLSRDWFKGEWRSYRARFVSGDGRVIDNGNGGISHSEGQGYGLLLALQAEDAASFDTIWHWTAEHLRKRSDALFAWRWDPQQGQATDLNNASDGDMLILWALVRAAKRFGRDDYAAEARRIMDSWAAKVVVAHGSETLLLPGATGFRAADQPAGPVVNPSYWIFAAFPDLAPLAPRLDWVALHRSGLRVIEASQFGPARLPAEWVSLGGSRPAPAANFPAQFGYNAIRIPLYLAQDPLAPQALLGRYAAADFPSAARPGPGVVDLQTGLTQQAMPGAGYRMVLALARCTVRSEPIPASLLSARDNFYYPETLRLLSVIVVQERFPRCL